MNKVQTDNAFLLEKIILREKAVAHLKSLCILDCYAGDGIIWNKIKERTGKEIKILRIDQKQDKKGIYLKGNNLKFVMGMDLNQFHIIDLDAYGTPYLLLKEIFKRNYKGILFITMIQVGVGGGNIQHGLLESLGYTKKMILKIPTLFSKNGDEKFKHWLYINGIRKINIIQRFDKNKKTYISINMKDQ